MQRCDFEEAETLRLFFFSVEIGLGMVHTWTYIFVWLIGRNVIWWISLQGDGGWGEDVRGPSLSRSKEKNAFTLYVNTSVGMSVSGSVPLLN